MQPFFVLVPFPHELLAALCAKHNLDERRLALALLFVSERKFEGGKRWPDVIPFFGKFLVQGATSVATGGLAGARKNFLLRPPAESKLKACG